LRRNGRFTGQRPVVEENTTDEAINVHEEDSDDDFVPLSYPRKQATGSNESKISKGKKRAANDKKLNRIKKNKGEAANVDMRDTRAESETGPSRVRQQNKKTKKSKSDSTKFRTRSSPKALYLALATLKPSQQDCVAKMGFGSLLEFKVDGISSRLGFYVVDMFDLDDTIDNQNKDWKILTPQLHESAGGLLRLKLSLHSCSLTGTIYATLLFYFCAEMVPVREHECNGSGEALYFREVGEHGVNWLYRICRYMCSATRSKSYVNPKLKLGISCMSTALPLSYEAVTPQL
ncbi:hypothetical protein Tco_0667170, partial [Tanacetum coccineum]